MLQDAKLGQGKRSGPTQRFSDSACRQFICRFCVVGMFNVVTGVSLTEWLRNVRRLDFRITNVSHKMDPYDRYGVTELL